MSELTYLTVPEGAEFLRTSAAVLYQWIAEKRIPAACVARIGRKILLNRFALEQWAANGGSPATKNDGVKAA